MDGGMGERLDTGRLGMIDGKMHRYFNEGIGRVMNGGIGRQLEKEVNGGLDGGMGRWMDGGIAVEMDSDGW